MDNEEPADAHVEAFKAVMDQKAAASGLFGLNAGSSLAAPIGSILIGGNHISSGPVGSYFSSSPLHLYGMHNQAVQSSHLSLVAQQHAMNMAMMQQASQLGLSDTIVHAPTPAFLKPDPKVPDTLGWREWMWDDTNKCLKSPSMGTLWPTAEHVAPNWSSADPVRNVAGIHAHLVPRHWKILPEFEVSGGYGGTVTGIVERYGKYVLGTEGWRAEQVVIRELLAPSTEIGLELEQRYPDVIVHYSDQNAEGDQSWKSEKSSKSGKGSRSLLASLPSSPSLPPIPKQNLTFVNVSLPTFQQANQLAQQNPGVAFQYDDDIPPSDPKFPPLLAAALIALPAIGLLIARLLV